MEFQERLQAYLDGAHQLSSSEIEQVGFRVAKQCEVPTIQAFDHIDISWQGDALFSFLAEHDPELEAEVFALLDELEKEDTAAHGTMSLRELLIREADPARESRNMDLYLMTNMAGAGEGFEGADAAASWWHRNFRMLALLQQAATPGERVLVIAGSGHTAILRQLLEVDRRIRVHSILPYL